MATISNTIDQFTTSSDLQSILLNNIDFDEGCGSLAKADVFIKAARAWMFLNPGRATHGGRGGEEIVLNTPQVKQLLDQAMRFRESALSSIGGNTRFLEFCDYRK